MSPRTDEDNPETYGYTPDEVEEAPTVPRKPKREPDEELMVRVLKDRKLMGRLLHRLLSGGNDVDAIITRILTTEELTGVSASPLGLTVGNRQAFPDFDRILLVTIRRIELLIELVIRAPDKEKEEVFRRVYLRGFTQIGHHLTVLAFGYLHPSVRERLDDAAYVRCMCLDSDAGLAARADFLRQVRDYVTAPSSMKLIEKANEQPTQTPKTTVETVDVD